MRRLLLFTVFAAGFLSSASQVILLRELLVVFEGNELSIGFILAVWLLLVAAGSFLFGRLSDVLENRAGIFASLLTLFAVMLPATTLLARSLRIILGIPVGQTLGPAHVFFSSLFLLTPVCIILGAQFTFGCKLASEISGERTPAASVGLVYILEAFGAALGGIALSLFLIQIMSAFSLSLALSAAAAGLAIFILILSRRVPALTASLLVCICALSLLFSPLNERIEQAFTAKLWEGFEVLASRNSPYANLVVTKRFEQYNVFANSSCILTSPTPDVASLEEFVHFPLLAHRDPKSVLLIGGGIGQTIDEALKHPVEELCYVELDPSLIKLAKTYVPSAAKTLSEPRVKVEYLDGRLYVKTAKQKYDVVLLNLPAPSSLQLNRFYSAEFFIEVKRILNEGGIFALSLPAQEAYMSAESRNLNRCINKTLKETFNNVFALPGNSYIYLAPTGPLDAGLLAERHKERKLRLRVMNPDYINYKLRADKLSAASAVLGDGGGTRINRDFRPIGTYYCAAFWNSIFYPRARYIFGLFLKLKLWHLAVLLALFSVFFAVASKRRTFPSLLLAISSSGFFAMGLDVVLIFAFQILFGYVYQMIGLMTGSFMAGLSLGSYIMTRRMEKSGVMLKSLTRIDALIAFYSLVLPVALSLLSIHMKTPQVRYAAPALLALFNIIGAVLVGMEFPLANKLCIKDKMKLGHFAGGLYAADLFGAFAAAIMAGAILVPILGIPYTLIFIALLKFASWSFLSLRSFTEPLPAGRQVCKIG